MLDSGQEGINMVERLKAQDQEFLESLAETVLPSNSDAWPEPYDSQLAAEAKERRDTSDIGELRRRLYIAERHGFTKLAAMWRGQIRELEEREPNHGQ